MKRIQLSILFLGLIALTGCGGGSGTPLPPTAKTAKIVFRALSTTRTLPINTYVIGSFAIPAQLAIATTAGTNNIATGAISGSGSIVGGSYFANYSTPNGRAKSLTVAKSVILGPPVVVEDLGFGPFLTLTCTYTDQSLTKSAITSLLNTLNPGALTVNAGLVDPANPGTQVPQAVFFNYSVSIQ